MDNINPTEGKELSYDLRQYQAKMIGDQILRVTESQDLEPHQYFSELDKLYVTIHHKLKDIKQGEKEYTNHYEKIVKLSNTYKSAWSGTKGHTGYNEIIYHLKQFHMWLLMRIEEANLFGAKFLEDEDEL